MFSKDSIINFLLALFRIGWIGVCIFLFKTEHYLLGFIAVIIFIESIFHALSEAGRNRKVELSWMSEALINKESLKRLQEESRTYVFIHDCIAKGRIKKGMTIKELDGIFKEINSDKITWMLHAENPTSEHIVSIEGYGCHADIGYNMPTPVLELGFKNGKLIRWKRTFLGKSLNLEIDELLTRRR